MEHNLELLYQQYQQLQKAYALPPLEANDPTSVCMQLMDFLETTLQQNEIIKQTYENRYRLVALLMNDVFFELHLQQNIMCDSTNWDRVVNAERFVKGSVENHIVHPDDVDKFLFFFSGDDTVNEVHEILIRIRLSYEATEYTWTSVKGIILPDAHGAPEKIIGSRTPFNIVQEEMNRLSSKAQIDELTSLYNKAATQRLAQEMLKKYKQLAFVMCDIDDFKTINDTYGHVFGDMALKSFASILATSFTKDAVIGRVGGDEFMIVFAYLSIAEVKKQIQLLIDQFTSIRIEDHEITLAGSVGVALYPEDGDDFISMFSHADKALYQAKNLGKHQYCIYIR